MFAIAGQAGESLRIPSDADGDRRYFDAVEFDQASAYLREQGYVVIRGIIQKEICTRINATVASELAQYRGFLYRQATGYPEVNQFNDRGFIMNPLLNVQDVPSGDLGRFRAASLEALTWPYVQDFLKTHFAEPGKLVQSMYFQGNTATWAHQDTYYLDAETIGTMVAGWFALEDIRPGAGRFFVYPKSHLIDVRKNGGDFDIAFNHERYKKLVIEIVKESGIECVAPALQKGDVLFWNSKTIHGSLETLQPEFSRSSLTAHYIPESERFLQYQARIKSLRLRYHNGMQVNHPKSLDVFSKRSVLWVETTFPKAFRAAKKMAIKALVR